MELQKQLKLKEVFLPIENFELYEVSNYGNVRNKRTGRQLRPSMGGVGYYTVCLSKDGLSTTFNVHRLVAEAFISNPESKRTVDHINHNKSDNSHFNLRWATNSENGMNCVMKKNNKSGAVGVRWSNLRNLWRAYLMINRHFKHLRDYNDISDAIKARKEGERLYSKEYASK